MMVKQKRIKSFGDAMSLFSFFGFLALAILIFLKVDISVWQTSVLMLLAGVGLFVEGELMKIKKWAKDGIQKDEVEKVLAIVVGLFSMIVGILKLPFINVIGPGVDNIVGIVAIFALVLIALERWIF